MRALAPALVCLLVACVQIPPFHASEVSDGPDVSDGPEVSADDTPPPTIAAPTLGLRSAHPVDLNGDAYLDLIVTNAHVAPEHQGLLVALGSPDGVLGGYHAFVPTPVAPYGFRAIDLVGDDAPDLLVYGADADEAGYVLLYETLDADAPQFAESPWTRETTASAVPLGLWDGDSASPVFVTAGDVTGDAVPDVIANDHQRVLVIAPSAWTAESFEVAPMSYVQHDTGFQWELAIRTEVVDVPGGPRWLVVKDQYGLWSYQATGSGLAHAAVFTPLEPAHYREDVADVDGDGVVDFFGGSYANLSAWLVVPPGGEAHAWSDPGGVPGPVDHYDSVRVHDVDGDETLDAVLLDNGQDYDEWPSALRLLRGLTIAEGALDTSPVSLLHLPLGTGVDPEHLAVGDFDGDERVEILAFDEDGPAICYRWSPDLETLAPCD